ncbi:MAG: hypothetical protein ACUVWN_04430 [bacterium]
MKIQPFLFIFLFFISGCAFYMHISEINDDPQRYQDKTVIVKGTVVETVAIPIIHDGLYQIDDNTGKIWVLSKDVPYRGERVIVKGEVKTAITINKRTFGTVIIEEDKEIKGRSF